MPQFFSHKNYITLDRSIPFDKLRANGREILSAAFTGELDESIRANGWVFHEINLDNVNSYNAIY